MGVIGRTVDAVLAEVCLSDAPHIVSHDCTGRCRQRHDWSCPRWLFGLSPSRHAARPPVPLQHLPRQQNARARLQPPPPRYHPHSSCPVDADKLWLSMALQANVWCCQSWLSQAPHLAERLRVYMQASQTRACLIGVDDAAIGVEFGNAAVRVHALRLVWRVQPETLAATQQQVQVVVKVVVQAAGCACNRLQRLAQSRRPFRRGMPGMRLLCARSAASWL